MKRAAHFPGLFGKIEGVAVKTKEGGRYNAALLGIQPSDGAGTPTRTGS